MVRAMFSRNADFDAFLKDEIVAVGWSAIDFSKYKSEELYRLIWDNYYKGSAQRPQTISRSMNQAIMFKNIKSGDRIVVPFRSGILIAVANDVEKYSEEAKSLDLANQHKVSFKRNADGSPVVIQRKDLSEKLQRRLHVMGMAVLNLSVFNEEIEKFFVDGYKSFDNQIREREENEEELFKKELLKRIQLGNTHLKTGGIGLENLVCELMICEGYEARILSKRAFSNTADADIEAVKEDSFFSKKILVQVKHHYGYSGEWGLQQLNEIRKIDQKYSEYDFLLITSASVSDDIRKKASDMDIGVIDGVALVDLIYCNIEKISIETKRKLGISLIPHLN